MMINIHDKVLSDDTIPDMSKLPPASGPGRQRRVLLLSEKRSGGQAVGGILNADPGAFYVADPCRMGGGPEALDSGACSLAVLRLLACQPTINDVRNLFSFSYIVERVRERERTMIGRDWVFRLDRRIGRRCTNDPPPTSLLVYCQATD